MPKRKAGCERRRDEDGVAEGEARMMKLAKSENEIKSRVVAQVEDEGQRLDLLEEYKHLTNGVLPAEARKHTGTASRWPIRLNHCFQRVILDNLFQDVWYPHLSIDGEDGSKPPKGGAMHRLRIDQLVGALEIGRQMRQGGAPIVRELNERSLAWRGKQRRRRRHEAKPRPTAKANGPDSTR
jgi:hypothetical protein